LAIFQVWKDAETLSSIVKAKRFALSSFGWYFVANPSPSWKSFYLNDPCSNLTESECEFVLGGEACAWGETINDFNLQQMIWPLALAVAERLWSLSSVNSTVLALPRLAEKICQLNARGVESGPAAPSAPCK
jgi:hexosaminidase